MGLWTPAANFFLINNKKLNLECSLIGALWADKKRYEETRMSGNVTKVILTRLTSIELRLLFVRINNPHVAIHCYLETF